MAQDENERDADGRATPKAVDSMAYGVQSYYEDYYTAMQAGDAGKAAHYADKVREEVGGLLTAIGQALGDLPRGGAECP